MSYCCSQVSSQAGNTHQAQPLVFSLQLISAVKKSIQLECFHNTTFSLPIHTNISALNISPYWYQSNISTRAALVQYQISVRYKHSNKQQSILFQRFCTKGTDIHFFGLISDQYQISISDWTAKLQAVAHWQQCKTGLCVPISCVQVTVVLCEKVLYVQDVLPESSDWKCIMDGCSVALA